MVLRNGNFAVTPKSVPMKEMLASVESAISHLPQKNKDDIRSKVCSTLKQANPPRKQNITREEKQAMNNLKADGNIIIIKADKGNCTVVMDKTRYNGQVQEMLGDKNTYKLITDKRWNPTARTESDLQKKLLLLKKEGSLSEADYWKLRPFDSTPASFYGVPKIHRVEQHENDDHFTLPDNSSEIKVPLRPAIS